MTEPGLETITKTITTGIGYNEPSARGLATDILRDLAAAGLVIEQGWQPIETAPKDGTVVLLAGGEDDNAVHSREDPLFFQAPCRARWSNGGWLMALAEACHVGVMHENPTHWRPVPVGPMQMNRNDNEGGR